MDKVHYAVLEALQTKRNATTRLRAATRRDLQREMSVGAGALWRKLRELAEKGYVARGLDESREHTYFITESGRRALEEVKNEE